MRDSARKQLLTHFLSSRLKLSGDTETPNESSTSEGKKSSKSPKTETRKDGCQGTAKLSPEEVRQGIPTLPRLR